MKKNKNFFTEQSDNSEIKMQIVLTVFKLWLGDNKTKQNLSYLDLFAGQGIYDDGTFSTPICIMQEICANRTLAQKFSVVLNDKDSEYIARLRRAIMNVRNSKYIKTLITSRVVAERHMSELI